MTGYRQERRAKKVPPLRCRKPKASHEKWHQGKVPRCGQVMQTEASRLKPEAACTNMNAISSNFNRSWHLLSFYLRDAQHRNSGFPLPELVHHPIALFFLAPVAWSGPHWLREPIPPLATTLALSVFNMEATSNCVEPLGGHSAGVYLVTCSWRRGAAWRSNSEFLGVLFASGFHTPRLWGRMSRWKSVLLWSLLGAWWDRHQNWRNICVHGKLVMGAYRMAGVASIRDTDPGSRASLTKRFGQSVWETIKANLGESWQATSGEGSNILSSGSSVVVVWEGWPLTSWQPLVCQLPVFWLVS